MNINNNTKEQGKTSKNKLHDEQHAAAPGKIILHLEVQMITQHCLLGTRGLQEFIPSHRQV